MCESVHHSIVLIEKTAQVKNKVTLCYTADKRNEVNLYVYSMYTHAQMFTVYT